MFIDVELGWEFTDDDEDEEEAIADQEDLAPEAQVQEKAPPPGPDTSVQNPSEAMEPTPDAAPTKDEASSDEPTQADPA